MVLGLSIEEAAFCRSVSKLLQEIKESNNNSNINSFASTLFVKMDVRCIVDFYKIVFVFISGNVCPFYFTFNKFFSCVC